MFFNDFQWCFQGFEDVFSELSSLSEERKVPEAPVTSPVDSPTAPRSEAARRVARQTVDEVLSGVARQLGA